MRNCKSCYDAKNLCQRCNKIIICGDCYKEVDGIYVCNNCYKKMVLMKCFWKETAEMMDYYSKNKNNEAYKAVVSCRILFDELTKE
jgi:hypothetical protein